LTRGFPYILCPQGDPTYIFSSEVADGRAGVADGGIRIQREKIIVSGGDDDE